VSAGNLNIPRSYRKNVRLVGPILPVHPDKLPNEDELREKLGLQLSKPVVFVPISGPTLERAFLTEILSKILLQFPSDYQVVVSLGYPNTDDKPIRRGNVTIYKWIPHRFEYLKACDLVIGRAGHGTITQCMCYGKPMILVPTPNHTEQFGNAVQAMDLGVAEIIQQEEVSRERLLKDVKRVLTGEVPDRLKEVQREVLKYDGLDTVVKTIVETVGE
jgi:UDP:flavonoid glycosyltransferase YjiC (YdhE family)